IGWAIVKFATQPMGAELLRIAAATRTRLLLAREFLLAARQFLRVFAPASAYTRPALWGRRYEFVKKAPRARALRAEDRWRNLQFHPVGKQRPMRPREEWHRPGFRPAVTISTHSLRRVRSCTARKLGTG